MIMHELFWSVVIGVAQVAEVADGFVHHVVRPHTSRIALGGVFNVRAKNMFLPLLMLFRQSHRICGLVGTKAVDVVCSWVD